MNSVLTILTVTQLNFYVRSLLESDERLSRVYLRGEISNFTNHYRSGHYYMSLKDENAAIHAVMFRSNAQRLNFLPREGMRVIASGRVSVYERDGQYQFYIDDLQPDGIGALYVAFEQRKEKLAREGLFDEARKKPIPPFPERIGAITSPTGAALQDICNILKRRWPMAKISLYPAQVQGDAAAGQLAAGILHFNRTHGADVLICGRGGGSFEDLWAFNDEDLARAIAGSKIPVVSAVGHETDYTLADFAADCRAPTPSAAAELVSPDWRSLLNLIRAQREAMNKHMRATLDRKRELLRRLMSVGAMRAPLFAVESRRMNLDALMRQMSSRMKDRVEQKRSLFTGAVSKLDALSPLKVLLRGYSLVSDDRGVITGVGRMKPGSDVTVRFKDGTAGCRVLAVRPENTRQEADTAGAGTGGREDTSER